MLWLSWGLDSISIEYGVVMQTLLRFNSIPLLGMEKEILGLSKLSTCTYRFGLWRPHT